MNIIYEQQSSTYQKQGNYFIPCVAVREQKSCLLVCGRTGIGGICGNTNG